MSKAKLQYAKELIQEKQYAKARAVLKEIDHPTARQWLEKLNELDRSSGRSFQPIYIVGILAATMILMVVTFLIGRATSPGQMIPPTLITMESTIASDGFAVANLEASPTQVQTVQPTITPTDIPPSPVATRTPRPTRLPRPTSMPRPTRPPTSTPTPTMVPQVQQIGPIHDSLYSESFSVEVTLRNASFTKGDGFQRLGSGKIYAIAEVGVRNLGPGALRSISKFSFQIKDNNGAIRDATYVGFMDCEFDRVDLTAGGSVTGCIAFEVPDTGSLELIYAPFQYEGLVSGRYISFRIR